jgi:hypothetical protein
MLLCFTLATTPVHATQLVFEFDTNLPDNGLPAATPWLKATFDDSGGNTVTLTLDNPVGGDKVKAWYFNLDSDLDVAKLNIVWSSGVEPSTIQQGTNTFKADGDGDFDFLLTYPNDNNENNKNNNKNNNANNEAFSGGHQSVFTITYDDPDTLVADSFDFLSFGAGNSPDGQLAAAHAGSWVVPHLDNSGGEQPDPPQQVPEPASLLLVGSGLVGVAAGWRRKLRK